jgi:hypothetical protein
MANGHWWTIPALAAALQCTECGASARIRDQRKERFGGHKIVKRPAGGAFEYRMLPGREAGHEKA